MLPDGPFVLLDDARPDGAGARLYSQGEEIGAGSWSAAQVIGSLRRLAGSGRHVAGLLRYEAAGAFEPAVAGMAVAGMAGAGEAVAWFAAFSRCEAVADVAALLPDPAGAFAGAPQPGIGWPDYARQFAEVQELIAAGDLYQANLSFRARVPVAGHPAALYAQLRQSAAAGYGALVFTGAEWILSLSPELFFTLEGGRLTARPMKGTVPRGATPDEDRAAAAALVADPKQRAENLMIVDLLRNDLSRVAVAGSVQVPRLFEVETYPTLHTMTSTVTADAAPGSDAVDVLTALFPCGSITGAPKIRAIKALAQIEAGSGPRGIYTGAIGRIDPPMEGTGGSAAFNVAIRTLSWECGAPYATIGLGGGIVADSTAPAEWAEALAKGAFVTRGQRPFDLIETMAFDPIAGLVRLERHLERLKASADAFGFAFDRHTARNELQAATFRLRAASRVRLVVAPGGAVAIEVAPMPSAPDRPLSVAVVPLPVDTADFRLRYKTSDRGFYDRARLAAETDEVVFVTPEGQLTEGSFTSLFVARPDGTLATPPLADGLLPGILRAELIERGQAVEQPLRPDDLARGFLLGNSLRGLMPAIVAVANASD